MLKPIIGIVAATLASPAIAEEYWVQYDYSTHECSIVESATHQTATRFPWSAPNDGSKPTEPLDGGTSGRADSSATKQNGTPNGSTSAAQGADGSATPNDTDTASGAPNKTRTPNTPNGTNTAGTSGSTNDQQAESPVVAAWKSKMELAQKEKIDVSTALIGSAMQTREQAEEEMHIMRRCGRNY